MHRLKKITIFVQKCRGCHLCILRNSPLFWCNDAMSNQECPQIKMLAPVVHYTYCCIRPLLQDHWPTEKKISLPARWAPDATQEMLRHRSGLLHPPQPRQMVSVQPSQHFPAKWGSHRPHRSDTARQRGSPSCYCGPVFFVNVSRIIPYCVTGTRRHYVLK